MTDLKMVYYVENDETKECVVEKRQTILRFDWPTLKEHAEKERAEGLNTLPLDFVILKHVRRIVEAGFIIIQRDAAQQIIDVAEKAMPKEEGQDHA